MTDYSSTCTKEDVSPILNKKMVIVKTPAGMASSDTLDVSAPALGNFASIDMVIALADDGTGASMEFTHSGTVITAGTITTGIHHLLIIGNSA